MISCNRISPYICGSEQHKRRKTMKTTLMNIQGGISVLGGILGWFLGGMDGLLYALVTFVGLYHWHVKCN